jgi:hypothetical protein
VNKALVLAAATCYDSSAGGMDRIQLSPDSRDKKGCGLGIRKL